jgi:hypothetical protein
LHRIRAHLLHYASLLDDFQKSVVFIRDTPNPAMNVLPEGQARSEQPLKSECDNLLGEIKRLEAWRSMLDKRVKNLMDLVGVLGLSRLTHELTEQVVRDRQYPGQQGHAEAVRVSPPRQRRDEADIIPHDGVPPRVLRTYKSFFLPPSMLG